jgi:hypothetical protein
MAEARVALAARDLRIGESLRTLVVRVVARDRWRARRIDHRESSGCGMYQSCSRIAPHGRHSSSLRCSRLRRAALRCVGSHHRESWWSVPQYSNDSKNFVSLSMRAGGWQDDYKIWYFWGSATSPSERLVREFYLYTQACHRGTRPPTATPFANVSIGDVVQWDLARNLGLTDMAHLNDCHRERPN